MSERVMINKREKKKKKKKEEKKEKKEKKKRIAPFRFCQINFIWYVFTFVTRGQRSNMLKK